MKDFKNLEEVKQKAVKIEESIEVLWPIREGRVTKFLLKPEEVKNHTFEINNGVLAMCLLKTKKIQLICWIF